MTKRLSSMFLMLVMTFGSVSALARMPHEVVPEEGSGSPPVATATATSGDPTAIAGAAAVSGAAAISGSHSSSEVESTVDVANRQSQGQGQGQQQGQTTINDNDYQEAFQVGRGIVIPVDCGMGFDAGGANRNGAAFLGMAWTTDKCYTLKAGNAFAAMGEYQLACEMYADVTRKAMKRRKIKELDCSKVAAAIIARQHPTVVVVGSDSTNKTSVSVPPDYATKEYVNQTQDRMLKQIMKK